MMWLDSGSGSPADHPAGSCVRLVEIEVDVSPDTATMLISGELDLVSMPVLAARLSVVLRQRPRRLIFDMAGTTFMDCACARLLASAGRLLPGRRPVIRRPRSATRRVLELTGLDAEFEIEELAWTAQATVHSQVPGGQCTGEERA
jgi:anti-anti-sigma factor